MAPALKKTPFWKTWVAVAVCAGLGAYAYFVESKHEDQPEKPKEKVFALDKSKVKELDVAPAGVQPRRSQRSLRNMFSAVSACSG